MLKKTKATIIFTLAAMLAAGSVTATAEKAATVQDGGSFLKNTGAEKLLYCETDYDYVDNTET